MYIHQLSEWPVFKWDNDALAEVLAEVRHRQGRLLGKMEGIGFSLREEATLQTLTQDVVKSSAIEGEILNQDQVRSSIARRLGMEVSGLVPSDRNVDGVVEMMIDATQRYTEELTDDRLFGWHASLFPTGRSGMTKIVAGAWRNNGKNDPMQVISGPMGRERVHYQAPDSEILNDEMRQFTSWFNTKMSIDPVLKAGIAHLWFVTIHPFEDGNGRIARAITDMQLARSDGSAQRFYSMSAQIEADRNSYYDILENTQKESLNITEWLLWFLSCFERALSNTDETLALVMRKAKLWENSANSNLNDRQKYMLSKLFDDFFGALNSSKWAKMAKCSQDTATRDLQDLVERGILIKENAGGRSTSYALKE